MMLHAPTMDYPDDCVQSWIGAASWWQESAIKTLARGTLLWTFVPYVGGRQELVPRGRVEPTIHDRLDCRLEASLNIRTDHPEPNPPCAALPHFPRERYAVLRGKVRPALVVSQRASYPGRSSGSSSWISKPSVLIAPFFGADADGSRSGWPPVLVNSIRRAQHPQYVWDKLPLKGSEVSILRLDQIHPLEDHSAGFDYAGYALHPDAMRVIDEWVQWYMTGMLDDEGSLYTIYSANASA